jgi:hypothetical protein
MSCRRLRQEPTEAQSPCSRAISRALVKKRRFSNLLAARRREKRWQKRIINGLAVDSHQAAEDPGPGGRSARTGPQAAEKAGRKLGSASTAVFQLPVKGAALATVVLRQEGDTSHLQAQQEGVVVRSGGNIPGNPWPGLQEGGEVHPVISGRSLPSAVPGERAGTGVEDTKSIHIMKLGNQSLLYQGALVSTPEMDILRILQMEDAVKVTHQHRRDRKTKARAKTTQHGFPGNQFTAARRKMKVDKRQRTPLDKLHVPGLHTRGQEVRHPGEDRHNAAGGVTDRLEDRVARRGGHRRKLRSRSHLLKEDEMRPILPEQGREASHVRKFEAVEQQDRKKRGRSLPTMPTGRRNRHWKG